MTKLELVLIRDEELIESHLVVRECPACGALVAEDKIGDHDRFHGGLRRAG